MLLNSDSGRFHIHGEILKESSLGLVEAERAHKKYGSDVTSER